MDSRQLLDINAARDYYDDLYTRGYMDEWPRERKVKISEIIKSLDLPSTGRALDFGCGSGVLTYMLRELLPSGWDVCGMDLSPAAIRSASQSYPHCRFFNRLSRADKFDLVFTHHVLEHVSDLQVTVKEICSYVNHRGLMLHILPCGDDGSLERRICTLRHDGVDRSLGDRFTFEDPGHIRRLTSAGLTSVMSEFGFIRREAFFANQFWGALDWITASRPRLISQLTDAGAAVSWKAHAELWGWRAVLLVLWGARFPAYHVRLRGMRGMRGCTTYKIMVLLSILPLLVLTVPMDAFLKAMACREWRRSRLSPGGSEMFVVFFRQGDLKPE